MKWCKRFLLLGAALVLLLAVGVVGPWQYYEYLTNVELERIRAAGEPLTDKELEDVYHAAANDFPNQSNWLATFAELDRVYESGQRSAAGQLDVKYLVFDTGLDGIPSPGSTEAAALLQRYATVLSLAQQAAAHPGPVQHSLDGATGNPGLAGHVRQLYKIIRLASSVHAQQGDAHAVANDLRMLLTLGRCLEFDPDLRGSAARFDVDLDALTQVVQTLQAIELSDADMEALQQAIRGIHYEKHYRIALLRQRINGLTFIEHYAANASYGVRHENFGTHPAWSPRTRLALLLEMRERIAAAELNWPQIYLVTRTLDFRRGKPVRIPLLAVPYERLEDMWVGSPFFAVMPQVVARTRAADAMIAIERYRRQHHRLPTSLEELTPQFLPAVPLDPIHGRPLRYRAEPAAFSVYSIGDNQNDDGGNAPATANGGYPDWGYRISLKVQP